MCTSTEAIWINKLVGGIWVRWYGSSLPHK